MRTEPLAPVARARHAEAVALSLLLVAALAGCSTRPAGRFDDSASPIVAAAFSAGVPRMVSGGRDGVVRVWDAGSGREVARRHVAGPAQPGGGRLRAVAISPDGTRVAFTGSAGDVHVWAWERDEAPQVLPGPPAAALAFSADGRELVAASGGADPDAQRLRPLHVTRWDVVTGAMTSRTQGEADEPIYLALSCDGEFVASCALGAERVTDIGRPMSGGVVRVRETRTGDVRLRGETPAVQMHFDFSPDGQRLATAPPSGGPDPVCSVWDLTTGARQRVGASGEVFLSADGGRLARLEPASSPNPFVRLWPFKLVQPDRRVVVTDLRSGRSSAGRTLARNRGEETVRLLVPTPERRLFLDTRLQMWKVPD